MKVVVCGSRYDGVGLERYVAVYRAIQARIEELPQGATIITGGARGVDRWADEIAGHRGMSRKVMRADWGRHGRKAGILRNLEMLDERPELVIGFWEGKSRGTKHMTNEARKRGIKTEVTEL